MVEASTVNLVDSGVDIAVTLPSINRADAAKKLAKRMLQGYEATSEKCPDCGVPLMSHRGIVRCVVCMEQLISASLDTSYSGSEKGMRAALRESRNDENDDNFIRVTEDGIEISPRLSPERSKRLINTWAPVDKDSMVRDDFIEHMLEILDDGTPSEDPSASRSNRESSSSWASGNMSSSAEFDVDEAMSHAHTELSHLADENATPPKNLHGPDVDVEIEKRDNEVSQDTVGSRQRQLALLAAEIVKIDAEIEKCDKDVSQDAIGSKQRQLALVADEIVKSTASSVLVSKGEEGVREISTKNVEAEDAHLLENNGERTNLLHQSSGQAVVTDASTMDCYAKGKAFATKIIAETDSVLSDLVSCEHKIEVPTTKSTASMLSGTSGAMRVRARPQKRTTINNLAKERSSGQKKSYMPAWENSMKNFVLDDEDSLNDIVGNKQPSTSSANKAISHRDDFFDELRHRALITKVTLVQEKLETSGFVTKRTGTIATSSQMHAARNDHSDVRARESPLFTYPNDNAAHDSSNAQPPKQGHHHGESGFRSELASSSPTKQKSEAELVNSMVPDDEKKYLALKCIREEKTVLPFDENMIASSRKSSSMLAVTSSSGQFTGNKNDALSVSQMSHKSAPVTNNSSSSTVDHAGSAKSCKQIEGSLSGKEKASPDVPDKNTISSESSVLSLKSHKSAPVTNTSCSPTVDHAGSVKSCKQIEGSLPGKKKASPDVPDKNKISSGSSVLSQKSNKSTQLTNTSSSSSVDHAGSMKSCKQIEGSLSGEEKASSDVLNMSKIPSGSSVLSKMSRNPIPVPISSSSSSAGTTSSRHFQAVATDSLCRMKISATDGSITGNDDNASSCRDATSAKNFTAKVVGVEKDSLIAGTTSPRHFQAVATDLLCRMKSAATDGSITGDDDNASLCHDGTSAKNFFANNVDVENDSLKTTRVDSKAAVNVSHSSLSIASLSSSIQVQQSRIAQLEAEAVRKHREAKLAAASAREALDVMVKARNERKNKIKSRTDPGADREESPTIMEEKCGPQKSEYDNCADKMEFQPNKNKEESAPCRNEDVFSAASASQYSHRESIGNYQDRGSSILNRMSDTHQFEDDGVRKNDDSSDGSTIASNSSGQISTSSSYLKKLRAAADKRKKGVQNRKADNVHPPITPEAPRTRRPTQHLSPRDYHVVDDTLSESSESECSFADSESSKSTLSTLDSSKRPSRITRPRHHAYEDSSRHRRSISASKRLMSDRAVSIESHLLLPSLTSSHPAGSKVLFGSDTTPRRTTTTRRHRRSHLIPLPARASQSVKPNHLLPFSPRSGFTNGISRTGERSFEARRPAPLSRRAESEPFYPDNHYQRPLMSQHPRELHYSDNGYGLPGLISKEPFSRGIPPSRFIANGQVPLQDGSRSLSPKSLHERERYGYNHLPPTPRTFDSLQLAQHQTIGERMASMNQATMAHNITPPLSLAHRQLIEENIALRNYQAMASQHFSGASTDAAAAVGQPFIAGGGHSSSIAAGYTLPMSHPPQSGRFGTNYEQLGLRGSSAGGQGNLQPHTIDGSDHLYLGNWINN